MFCNIEFFVSEKKAGAAAKKYSNTQYGEWLGHSPCKIKPKTRKSSLGIEPCLYAQFVRTLTNPGWISMSFFCHALQYQVILMFIVTESRCSDSTVEPSLMETPQQSPTRYNGQL